MELKEAADYFDKETFSVYDSTLQTWTVAGIQGRMLPIDRFLSNFSRPVHRRMLICNPDTIIPSSATIRSDATNQIYIIGQGRYDAYSNNPYQALYLAHLVNGLNGGVGVVTRRSPVGPVDNPDHLVSSVVGNYYMDVELRAHTPEEGTAHRTAGQYFLMAPPECELLEWDYISLNGVDYRVEEGYFDSGLRFARALQTEDDRVDFIYVRTTAFDYDAVSGAAIELTTNYNVTGSIHNYSSMAGSPDTVSENNFKIVIMDNHIGFEPQVRESVIVSGVTSRILGAAKDPLSNEWTITCQS